MQQRITPAKALFLIWLALFVGFTTRIYADDTNVSTTVASTTVASTTAASTTAPQASSTPSARDLLEAQIQTKAKELDTISGQLEAMNENLKKTQSERKGLQKELNTLGNNINQLNLNIKADTITIQKLNLEVDSLNLDLQDIKSSIHDKQVAISEILKELQKNEESDHNLLIVFLKSKSLADGILETQALNNLQSQLTLDIVNLRNLHDAYDKKIQETNDAKTQIAFHQKNLENRKAIVEDQKVERQNLLRQTKNRESLYEQQVAELHKRQQEIAYEIEALDAVLRTKIDPSRLPPLRPGVLAFPVAGNKSDITQDYGATAFAKYGYRGKWHNGIDIGEPLGTPVFAADDGVVAAVGNQDAYCYRAAYGKFIVINHPNNLTTLYAHLSRQVVKKGDTVSRGQAIGYTGRSGYATGPHLHFTVFAQPTFYMGPSKSCGPMPYGGDLNPLGYL